MALKKGFCTHCKGDEDLRIFDVNKDAEVCYCPHCMAAMPPKEAIANYNALIANYLKHASKALFDSTQYLEAYQTFAHIIDLNETIKVAHFGRIISMVHLSTLRKSKIEFALSLHRQEAPKWCHYAETVEEYYHFLLLLLDALASYETRIKKRITTHGIYYDMDCVILYLQRIKEIKDYKEFVAQEAKYFVDNGKEQFKDIIGMVDVSMHAYEEVYNEKYVTADGYTYLFAGFDSNGLPLVSIKNSNPNVDLRRHKIELYPKDNKKSQIKDEIYPNKLPMFRLFMASIPAASFLFTLAIVGIVFSFIITSSVAKAFILLAAALSILSALVFFTLHFTWKNALKKKYYNGMNPFILK